LRRLAEDRALLAKLTAGVRPPRASMEVAREMSELYGALLKPKPPAQLALATYSAPQ
jgi:hypothetical protein